MADQRRSTSVILTDPSTPTQQLAVDSSGRAKVDGSSVTQPVSGTVSTNHTTGSAGDGIKNVTTAGTRVTLASTTACKWVMIQARWGNTGYIAVGGATVVANITTGRGVHLKAGQSVSLLIDDLADISLDATVNGEGVYFTYGAA